MKIFNWVHTRFHHKDGYGNYGKKADCIENESETQALLKNVGLANVINGWSEGILTIGTFGFYPVEDFDPKTEDPVIEDKEEGKLNPLVVDNDKVELHCDDENVQQGLSIMTVYGNVICPYNKMEKGERITLADLLSADSSGPKEIAKAEDGKVRPEPVKKPAPNSKDGVLFSMKLLIPLGVDSHPLQKIHRLMKRMKKRKIHPDLEGKLLVKKEGTITATPTVLACFKAPNGPNHSDSLLQTQDGSRPVI